LKASRAALAERQVEGRCVQSGVLVALVGELAFEVSQSNATTRNATLPSALSLRRNWLSPN